MSASRTLCALLAACTALPAPVAAQRPGRDALSARVDSLARATMAAERIPGLAIGVVRGSDTIVLRGWGFADVEHRVAATPATVFRIGSITKQFTALIALQLVREGRLSLDDTVQRFVPDFPTPGRTITIRHLLTHTSGIPSYTSLGREWRERQRLDLTHRQLLALVKDRTPDFAPGERYRYNNSGYYLLGVVIEQVTGRPYAEVLRERLFTPLGLRQTRYCNTREIIADRAQGYETDSTNAVVNAEFLSMDAPFAAGALCSTVPDLLTWQAALTEDRLVPGAYAQMATPARLTSGAATSYGFGLASGDLAGHRMIGHGGGINGFSAMLNAFPDDSLVIVVLANSEDANAGRLAARIARAAFGIAEPVVRDAPLTAADRARYTGTYRLAEALDLRVFARGDSLLAQATGQGPFRLLRQEGDRFVASFDAEVRIEFEVDARGRATALTLFQGGARRAPRID